jgi:hypothetical protein
MDVLYIFHLFIFPTSIGNYLLQIFNIPIVLKILGHHILIFAGIHACYVYINENQVSMFRYNPRIVICCKTVIFLFYNTRYIDVLYVAIYSFSLHVSQIRYFNTPVD